MKSDFDKNDLKKAVDELMSLFGLENEKDEQSDIINSIISSIPDDCFESTMTETDNDKNGKKDDAEDKDIIYISKIEINDDASVIMDMNFIKDFERIEDNEKIIESSINEKMNMIHFLVSEGNGFTLNILVNDILIGRMWHNKENGRIEGLVYGKLISVDESEGKIKHIDDVRDEKKCECGKSKLFGSSEKHKCCEKKDRKSDATECDKDDSKCVREECEFPEEEYKCKNPVNAKDVKKRIVEMDNVAVEKCVSVFEYIIDNHMYEPIRDGEGEVIGIYIDTEIVNKNFPYIHNIMYMSSVARRIMKCACEKMGFSGASVISESGAHIVRYGNCPTTCENDKSYHFFF